MLYEFVRLLVLVVDNQASGVAIGLDPGNSFGFGDRGPQIFQDVGVTLCPVDANPAGATVSALSTHELPGPAGTMEGVCTATAGIAALSEPGCFAIELFFKDLRCVPAPSVTERLRNCHEFVTCFRLVYRNFC